MNQQSNESPGTKAYLVINAQVFQLNQRVTKIGRKIENDLVLQDSNISRFHAEIHFEDGKFVLIDLDSSSGTFLNNQSVKRALLFSGDIISLGSTPMMFMDESEAVKHRSEADTSTLGSP